VFEVAEKSGMSDLRHYCVRQKLKLIKQYAQKSYFRRIIANDSHRMSIIREIETTDMGSLRIFSNYLYFDGKTSKLSDINSQTL